MLLYNDRTMQSQKGLCGSQNLRYCLVRSQTFADPLLSPITEWEEFCCLLFETFNNGKFGLFVAVIRSLRKGGVTECLIAV